MERRTRRSDNRMDATRYYLEALLAHHNLAGAALADEEGLLVAGTRGGFDTEALAAIAPLIADTSPEITCGDLLDFVTRGQELHVGGLSVGGAPYFLATLGDTEFDAREVEPALTRILLSS